MSLGLPSFSMIFTGKAVSAVERSARGIVAVVLADDTEGLASGTVICRSPKRNTGRTAASISAPFTK